MAVTVSYPGVYIQELPSGVHTITGVATSIGAFVDAFVSGPLNKAVQVLSFAAFEAQFGGLAPGSEASYAIQQFFLNGGSEAYVVRVTSVGGGTPATPAQIALEDKAGGSILLTASADGPGSWGANLRIDVDYGTSDPTSQFNLTVTEIAVSGRNDHSDRQGGVSQSRHRRRPIQRCGDDSQCRLPVDHPRDHRLRRLRPAARSDGDR